MEKDMLVLMLDSEDPQLFDLRQPAAGEPVFGIVRETLDQSGRYQEFRCRVVCDNGAIATYPVGRLVPLLILSEEDAQLAPKDAFSKWAAEIVKRQAFVHLPGSQRDFLADMLTRTR